MIFSKTKEQITLHGLGFLQVILPNAQRIHVWHPDLPKRSCFEHSNVHDHRFGFVSRVLIGQQINQLYRAVPNSKEESHTHTAYLHEGERTKFGNRPWVPDYTCKLECAGNPRAVKPGESYEMNPYMLHSTESNGIVVTLMEKTTEENTGAHSYCKIDKSPDVDFDRKQWSQDKLWAIFNSAFKNG